MTLISQIFFSIIITSFTGTVALAIWKMTRKFFLAWNPSLMYLTLRLVCLLYVLPFGYVIVQLTVRDGYIQPDGIWQLNFAVTGIMKYLFLIFGCVWFFLSSRCAVKYIKLSLRQREFLCGNVPEEDEAAIEEFARIKKKLGIHRNIELCRNDMLGSPMITGIIFCKVILPYRRYSREQLRVIFYHELSHYKSHDLLYKWCGVYVGTIQHLNSFSEDLLELLNEWGEYHCDKKAIQAMGGEMETGRYFDTIIDIMRNAPQIEEEDYIFSMLCENRVSLERRIDYMKRYKNVSRASKVMSYLLAFGFVVLSLTTTYAGGRKLVEAHNFIYKSTEQITREEALSNLEETFLPAEEDQSYDVLEYENPESELIMPILEENVLVNSTWTVAKGVRHVSDKIKLEAGQVVSISCTSTPADMLFWIGIMNSDGDVRFTDGTGSVSHNFVINEADSYRVLVQNMGKVTITSSISYCYYTPE